MQTLLSDADFKNTTLALLSTEQSVLDYFAKHESARLTDLNDALSSDGKSNLLQRLSRLSFVQISETEEDSVVSLV